MPGRGGNSSEFSGQVQARLTQILDQIIDAPQPPLSSSALPHQQQQQQQSGNNNGDDAVTLAAAAEVRDPGLANMNHLFFDWDMSMYLDSQLDLFSQSLL
jgi:hypothetical protein